MDVRTADSRMLDLYEEMLYARSATGFRPLLYVSSSRDLECNVLMLLNAAPELTLAGQRRTFASGVGQHVRTI